eukprot:6044175-Amphidinium_carterae.1
MDAIEGLQIAGKRSSYVCAIRSITQHGYGCKQPPVHCLTSTANLRIRGLLAHPVGRNFGG